MSSRKILGSRVVRVVVVVGLILGVKFGYRVYQRSQGGKPQSVSFSEARASHATKLLVSEGHDSGPLPELYTDDLEHTHYEGPLGMMGAIATPIGESGAMKPAVVWVTGGFGGIAQGVDLYDSYENDQGIASFLRRGIVVFLPAFRGEHENPGVFECFYGEVDDLVAAVEHVAKRVDVDPKRIYLMGHSTGGTNALLASLLTDIPAGVVSFGGAPDMAAVVADGYGYEVEPYDMRESKEVRLRSAIRYTKDIQVPVLYIEGAGNPFYAGHARRMERIADEAGVDFTAAIIQGADHFSVLRPIKDLLASRIESGVLDLPSLEEVQNAYTDFVENPDNRLLKAVESGTASELREILEAGADPNARSDYGWPAVMVAANDNDSDVVALLLEAGADVNSKNTEGGTPLIVASIRNQENVEVLISAGADVNALDSDGVSALMYAVSYSNDVAVIDSLLAAGPDVNLSDSTKSTVLMYAAMNTSNPEIIRKLIEAGADVHALDDRGLNTLMIAAMYTESPEVIRELVGMGSKIDARTKEGVTALILAARYTENPQIVQVLIEEGASVHYTDSVGNSAIRFAERNEALKGTKAFEMLSEASQ